MRKLELYLSNLFVALDQLLNVILGGSPDETVSSRAAKRRHDCRVCNWLCRALDKIDRGHCDRYIERDEGHRDVY